MIIVKRILMLLGIVVLDAAAVFVTVVGPWPAYSASDVAAEGYYLAAVAAADASLVQSNLPEAPQKLGAGWAKRSIVPEIGVPLAGFGDRRGRPSTGVHDEIHVKALALTDGYDTVCLVGSDMLIVPENVADAVREDVSARTILTAGNILFSASHTHSGPGAFGPGFVSNAFNGEYDPAVPEFLARQFADAIVEAHDAMKPARLAHGGLDAPDCIRNRTRDAATDSELSYLVIEQEGGARCYVVSFSGHPTILGGRNMEFSGDYPGALQRTIEAETGGFAMYLGGALGSMSVQAREGANAFARVEATGAELARRVLEDAAAPEFAEEIDVASIGFPFDLPPMGMRLSKSWRLSPLLLSVIGIDSDGWLEGVRVGDVFLYGTPSDFSGEISTELKGWASQQGIDLWVTSFNGDYVGYVSPDRYYDDVGPEQDRYEMGLMSWLGPNQEAFFTGLMKHMAATLFPEQGAAS